MIYWEKIYTCKNLQRILWVFNTTNKLSVILNCIMQFLHISNQFKYTSGSYHSHTNQIKTNGLVIDSEAVKIMIFWQPILFDAGANYKKISGSSR